MSISFSTYVLNLASVYNQLETGVEVAVGAVLTSGLWVASTLLSNCFHTLENPVYRLLITEYFVYSISK